MLPASPTFWCFTGSPRCPSSPWLSQGPFRCLASKFPSSYKDTITLEQGHVNSTYLDHIHKDPTFK